MPRVTVVQLRNQLERVWAASIDVKIIGAEEVQAEEVGLFDAYEKSYDKSAPLALIKDKDVIKKRADSASETLDDTGHARVKFVAAARESLEIDD